LFGEKFLCFNNPSGFPFSPVCHRQAGMTSPAFISLSPRDQESKRNNLVDGKTTVTLKRYVISDYYLETRLSQ
jgi:hypothetical protein